MLSLVLSAAMTLPVFAEISLSGEQDGFLETGSYLVTSPITVKRGKTLSFAPGCIVRFNRYTGILVEGALKCAGTEGLPILFTSANHRVSSAPQADAPAPFDWNGIVAVDSQSVIDLEYVHIIYSTFGLDVKSPASSIRLFKTVFDENGRLTLKVAGRQLDPKDNVPFDYPPLRGEGEVDSSVTASEPVPSVQNEIAPAPAFQPPQPPHAERGKRGHWKRTSVRIGCAALAALGGISAIYYDGKIVSYNKKIDGGETDTHRVNSYRHDAGKAEDKRNISEIVAILGVCGFAVTFLF